MNKRKTTPAKRAKKPLLVKALNGMGMTPSAGVENLLGWVQALVVAGLLAWIVLTFVLVRMTVPTGSMVPTIRVGTSFFVDKISYFFRDPVPGDIVVFWKTEENGLRDRLVKRLIAVGGQSVTIQDCNHFDRDACGVFVDGQKLSGAVFDRPYYTVSSALETQQWEVPEGHYFVLGDNSPISKDSRYWGFMPEADLIGEPFLRVWPLDQLGFMNGYFGSAR